MEEGDAGALLRRVHRCGRIAGRRIAGRHRLVGGPRAAHHAVLHPYTKKYRSTTTYTIINASFYRALTNIPTELSVITPVLQLLLVEHSELVGFWVQEAVGDIFRGLSSFINFITTVLKWK